MVVECATDWVSQSVRESVSLGFYDFLSHRVTVPPRQAYILDSFDRDAWQPCEAPEETQLEPGTFELKLELYHPVQGSSDAKFPDIDSIIGEQLVTASAAL
jgi:hypothetical protein